MDRLKGSHNAGGNTAEMGIKNLSLGVPGLGFHLLYSVKHFEIQTMLLIQEALLEMNSQFHSTF